MFTKKSKVTQCCVLCFLIIGIMLLMTGCSALIETFGKDYRMVDDFWEQIEADIDFSFNEYFSNQELSAEQKETLDNGLKQLSLYIQNEKKANEITNSRHGRVFGSAGLWWLSIRLYRGKPFGNKRKYKTGIGNNHPRAYYIKTRRSKKRFMGFYMALY